MIEQNPTLIAAEYKKVVAAFKKRFDVQNGNALGYRQNQDPNGELLLENKPKSIGDGLATTGWCVSASQALLLDPIFQILLKDRGAFAKLVSIDIKEQYYGVTYSKHQNKWHTAILVQDSGVNLIVDITCKQFGNSFNDKDIWDFSTWEKTLRSPLDKHKIIDFEKSELSFLPIQNNVGNKFSKTVDIVNTLHNITTITDQERNILADFFLDKINVINKKLVLGNINKLDYEYMEKINKIIENLHFVNKSKSYLLMEFINKDSALLWIEKFLKNDCILQQFMVFADSVENSCKQNDIDVLNLNKESTKNVTYVIIEAENAKGFEVDFLNNGASLLIPYGIKLTLNPAEDIYNAGKFMDASFGGIEKKTNTIYIKCSN